MKKYVAEFIGTFALVFCGTGAAIVNEQTNGSLGLLGVSVAFGIIITVMASIFGNISGTHINPAVTIGLVIGNLFPKKEAAFYILSQILGAILASSVLHFMFPENLNLGATLPSGSYLQTFLIELILTFFLMLTILGITSSESKETRALSGIVIGASVIAFILIAGPISGGSFNPARSLAPALISMNLNALWLYILAPIVGAIIATLTWNILFQKKN